MPKVKQFVLILAVLLAPTLVLTAKSTRQNEPNTPTVTRAVGVIHPIGKSKVHGVIVFTQTGKTVSVTGNVSGLTPGKHGFHVHEFGDCTDTEKGMSAGSHFDPGMKHKHGGPKARNRHTGDLGNITADDDGNAKVKIKDTVIKLNGMHSVIGRSIIVHAKEDDLKDIASAGPRIGCGVIGIAAPKK
jgi:Cu-Zn family superoxide dismutase